MRRNIKLGIRRSKPSAAPISVGNDTPASGSVVVVVDVPPVPEVVDEGELVGVAVGVAVELVLAPTVMVLDGLLAKTFTPLSPAAVTKV